MRDESTVAIHDDRRPRTVPTDAPDGLDWESFHARYFPDRRRHDLEALTAYGTYRSRSRPRPKRASGEGAPTGSTHLYVQ